MIGLPWENSWHLQDNNLMPLTQEMLAGIQCKKINAMPMTTGLKVHQGAKKVLSDSPGLVDFAIGLVNSVFTCPTGK